MSDKKPKYAVVVVHGIGKGTGKGREGFSRDLKANVVKQNPEYKDYWLEATWEGLNDAVDTVVKHAADELFDGYIRDAEAKKLQVAQRVSRVNVESGCQFLRMLKKCYVWGVKLCIGIAPGTLKKAKLITPDALDAVLDLPIYLGSKTMNVCGEVSAKIEEGMRLGVEGVILIGHSLGSVIAFDVLRNELEQQSDSRIKALVTMGSPLEWVAKIRSALDNNKGVPVFDVRGTKWINYYDPQDPVTLRHALNTEMFNGVENVEDVSAQKLIKAHCAYWKSPRIANKIVELMTGNL